MTPSKDSNKNKVLTMTLKCDKTHGQGQLPWPHNITTNKVKAGDHGPWNRNRTWSRQVTMALKTSTMHGQGMWPWPWIHEQSMVKADDHGLEYKNKAWSRQMTMTMNAGTKHGQGHWPWPWVWQIKHGHGQGHSLDHVKYPIWGEFYPDKSTSPLPGEFERSAGH